MFVMHALGFFLFSCCITSIAADCQYYDNCDYNARDHKYTIGATYLSRDSTSKTDPRDLCVNLFRDHNVYLFHPNYATTTDIFFNHEGAKNIWIDMWSYLPWFNVNTQGWNYGYEWDKITWDDGWRIRESKIMVPRLLDKINDWIDPKDTGVYFVLEFWVRKFDKNIIGSKQDGFRKCRYPQPIGQPVSEGVVANGQYFTDYTDGKIFLGQSFVFSKGITRSCAPGTYNTCKKTLTCNYNIPWKGKERTMWDNTLSQIQKDFVLDSNNSPPLGNCYPCKNGAGRIHYWDDSIGSCNRTFSVDSVCKSSIGADEANRIYCKGGKLPPILCPVDKISNSDYSGCRCPDGKKDVEGTCQPCSTGHYCVNGEEKRCEADSYQGVTGQTSCISCISPKRYCPVGNLPVACNASNAINYQITPDCVPCAQCKHHIFTKYMNIVSKLNEGDSFGTIYCYI